jgi:hypothetical protein
MVSSRRRPPILRATVVASFATLAALSAAGGSASPIAAQAPPKPVVEAVVAPPPAPCCVEIVQAVPAGFAQAPAASQLFSTAAPAQAPAQMAVASRWRVVPRVLPVGIAPERGLQVDTIFLARSVSARFPQIRDIGGVRPDGLRWHPNGLALDVMIPNPSSDAGIKLGNDIVAWALNNAERFDLQDAIWRDVYYTPGGARSGGMGHYDHVHLTTHGGGYPTGSELYYR